MPSYVAFLRAVNVGGRFVKMAELRAALERGRLHRRRDPHPVRQRLRAQRAPVHRRGRHRDGAGAGEFAGFDVPCVVRTPAQLRATLAAVDAVPPLIAGGKRYVAFADGAVPTAAAEQLDAWDEPGERCRVLGAEILAELTDGFQKTKLTNTRIERITGRTTTWRDLKVVRAIDEKWGA